MITLEIIPVRDSSYLEEVGKVFSELLNNSDVYHVKLHNNKVEKLATFKCKCYDGKCFTKVLVSIDSSPMIAGYTPRSTDKVIRAKWILYLSGKGMIQDHIAHLLEISQSLVSNVIKSKGKINKLSKVLQ